MNTFFTADTHFGHANIIRFSKRPFASIEEHDEGLIERWNRVVTWKDDVWHLGDFNFRSALSTYSYRHRLNGKIHMVWGNHDDKNAKRAYELLALKASLFSSAQDVKYLKLNGEKITLYHYAQRVWRGSHHGDWHLFGHSHGSLPNLHRSMDVGVDRHDYTPISFEQVREYMKDKDVTLHHPELVTDPWDKGEPLASEIADD